MADADQEQKSAAEQGREQLSADTVRKVATLARLAPSDEQVEVYRGQLAAVLVAFDTLRKLDLTGIEPLVHVSESSNRLDEDIPGEMLSNQTLIEMAPDSMPPYVRVPRVLDEGGGA